MDSIPTDSFRVLQEIAHVLAMCDEGVERDRLLAALWDVYEKLTGEDR